MIQEVSMTNWRAFDQCSFQFKPGLNFIMGPNGKGKTSILEAIVYGLTGEPSVVEDRNQLLRDPSKPATIIITFRVDSTDFRIERTQQPGKAGDASIWDLDANRRIAAYHKNVTEEVGRLIGVSADFLRRIVYMAEGDVFRFLQDPPGKAMNEQVQRVLGLTQLDQFRDAIRLSQRDLREDSKSLKSLRRRMLDFNLWMEQDLEIKLGELDSKRELHMEEIYDTQEQLAKLQEQYQSLNSLGSQILDRIGFLRANAERWERIDERPLIMYFDELQEEISKSREQNVELEKALARLNGQQDVHTRVLELLSGTKSQHDVIPCPVCKKPMTLEERQQVIEETEENLREIKKKIDVQHQLIKEAKIKTERVISFSESLREIRNNLVHSRYNDIDPNMTLPEIMEAISKISDDPKIKNLQDRKSGLQKQVDEVEQTRGDYVSIQTQLRSQGFTNPRDVQDALIQIEARQMALKAAYEATEDTLADMRDVDLISIYEQIATIWNNFMQNGKMSFRLDQQGRPILQVEGDREFQFSQFSGGEKTALLVMIHTIIAHHFSQCKFLFVDEPLEHLDPVNRRSLMRFFVAASQNNIFDQAIITTYEESLVRKFISEAEVNTIHIY